MRTSDWTVTRSMDQPQPIMFWDFGSALHSVLLIGKAGNKGHKKMQHTLHSPLHYGQLDLFCAAEILFILILILEGHFLGLTFYSIFPANGTDCSHSSS